MKDASPTSGPRHGPIRRYVTGACAAVLVVLVAMQALAFVDYVRDQERLAALISQIASPLLPPSQQAIAISDYLSTKPHSSSNSYFLLPVFRFLRPTPLQVAEDGGDCADRSRLMIVLLELRHIHATKWAIYTPAMEPRHAVVELDSEQGKMVIDPLFGVWYPRPNGGFFDIESMRSDPTILRNRILELRAENVHQGQDRPEWYPLDQYIYTYARTINWNKSVYMRVAYDISHAVIGDRVNDIARPEWAEQPALMLIVLLVPFEIIVLCVMIWSRLQQPHAVKAAEPEPTPAAERIICP